MKFCKECYGKGYVFEYNDIRIPCDCVEEVETIKDLKRELNISNADLAKCFNMSYGAYANSTAKERYENTLLNFYKLAKKGWEKNKTKNLTSDNQTIKHKPKLLTIHGVVKSLPTYKVIKLEREKALKKLNAQSLNNLTLNEQRCFKSGFTSCYLTIAK